MLDIIKSSLLFRAVTAAAGWFDRLWHESRIVSWLFSDWHGCETTERSLLTRFGRWLRRLWCALFRALRLPKVLEGSVFRRSYLWCALTLTLAPILPTSAVIALACVSFLSFLLNLGCDGEYRVAYAPANKFILLFAFVYVVATFTSVTPSGSLISVRA